MEGVKDEENLEEAPLVSLLKIDVVMRKLESFLNLEDLCHMREVSIGMNQVVLCQTKFLSKCKIVLGTRVYEDPCFERLTFQPKTVSFSVFKTEPIDCVFDDQDLKNQEITARVSKLVENCENLEIRDRHFWANQYFSNLDDSSENHTYNFDEISPPEHCPVVLDVILGAKNLKELKLIDGTELFFNKAGEEHAKALDGVQRIEFDNDYPCYCPPIFLKLRGLRRIVGTNSCDCKTDSTRCKIHEQHERFKNLIVNNRETLSKLDLRPTSEWFCSKYFSELFPSLKSLKLEACGKKSIGCSAVEFLENHLDQLEELHLRVASFGADQVLNTFSKCKDPFYKLKLVVKPGVDVNSLGDCMKHIKNIPVKTFKLITPWEDDSETHGATVDIFASLPLSLRSFTLHCESGMFYDHSKLRRSPLLTYLELNAFIGPLNSTLEAICKYLPNLKSLNITCNGDVPVPGAVASLEMKHDGNDTGSTCETETFENLQDLEILEISGPCVSLDIINGIKCPKLQKLIIPNELSLASLVKVLRDNPRLKSIYGGSSIDCRFS